MNSTQDLAEETKKKLDQVSPSFCLAKWLQVTMHLQNGQTHSCHHPGTHSIPLAELENNKTALHNTEFKKKIRQQMLEGKRPAECQYCWNIENLPGKLCSDRHLKSSESWAAPEFDALKKMPWDYNVNPTYVEVSFSNVCNFKCAYCSPQISSKWAAEVEEHGPYPTHNLYNNLEYLKKTDMMPRFSEKENPYVKAFWQWWPELYSTLKVFRITGGEPLLSKNTFKILDYIQENPNKNLELMINSNLGVSNELVQKFAKSIVVLKNCKALKSVGIFTSIDTWGADAEYIRTGLDLEVFLENIDTLFRIDPKTHLTIMCTFNMLSIFRFKKLLLYVRKQRKAGREVVLDISYLRNPEFLNVKLLPERWKKEAAKILQFMIDKDYYEFEIIKMKRLVEYMNMPPESDEWLQRYRQDFLAYTKEHDRRRKTKFMKTFKKFAYEYSLWNGNKESKTLFFVKQALSMN